MTLSDASGLMPAMIGFAIHMHLTATIRPAGRVAVSAR
ncbi:hypothetical protein AGR7A_Cc120160 [Agrobacterium deltaense NCPPB 1641]|uniref:Uncharacterized protein n=1 Tax=Agrobacterium deltaense NCPPB 1641 TaxID=1183425 RepID=A0A1S7TK61_9HYPH|nr:hypothetical protein AGR7A_Cc120160 [Agrobacterium deltaense NCPPB 1641]